MRLLGRELVLDRHVPEATGDDTTVRPLVPVVEAVPSVVRDLEVQVRDRLGGDHLTARRDDQPLERAEQPARVPVRRDDDGLRAGVGRRLDTRVLVNLDAGSRRNSRNPAHEAGGLQNSVGRMEDRRRIPAVERRLELVEPLCVESVLSEGRELGKKLVAFLVVGRQSEAAGQPEGVPGDLRQVGHGGLAPAPELPRSLPTDGVDDDRVRRGTSSQSKTAVPPARPACDLPRVVEADPKTRLGQRQRARAARDAATHDGDVRRTVELRTRQGVVRLHEPVRGHWHGTRSYAGPPERSRRRRYLISTGPSRLGRLSPSYAQPSRS